MKSDVPKILIMLIILISVIFFVACRSNLKLGQSGKIEQGRVYLKCTKPQRRYARSIEVTVKNSLKSLDTVTSSALTGSVKSEVVKLADYSSKGLDLDLILFRLCEFGNNRLLTQEQTDKLVAEAIKSWTSKLTINEQKNILAQLRTELSSNLQTANELKKNVETVLSVLNLVSGPALLRHPKIPFLYTFFPASNLYKDQPKSAGELTDESIATYLRLKLDTNTLEKQRFTEAARLINATLDRTLPTLNSLHAKDGYRYPIYSQIWETNQSNLSKIEVFDITQFQTTYTDLHSLKANYDIILTNAIAYLSDLKKFFGPEGGIIKREDIIKILTSERLTYNLIETYSLSLVDNIQRLSELQQVVGRTLQ